jgi:hypothetical protein
LKDWIRLIVAPGADPKVMKLAFKGTNTIEIDEHGDLVIVTAGGTSPASASHLPGGQWPETECARAICSLEETRLALTSPTDHP